MNIQNESEYSGQEVNNEHIDIRKGQNGNNEDIPEGPEETVENINRMTQNTQSIQDSVRNTTYLPKRKQVVKYLPTDSSQWKTAKIISRAGKATGKYR